MKKVIAPLSIIFFIGCNVKSQTSPLTAKKILPHELKEISGVVAVANNVFAITDKPKASFYKLDTKGNLLQQVQIQNISATDVEAITADKNYLYIGDVGDNIGDRIERQIIKVAQADIGEHPNASVKAEVITFTFPQEVAVESKKMNNYDCESVLSFKDSLYVFTKDREDNETRLYALPKQPGKYTARLIDSFNSKGLITDAAVNAANNEVALIGYHKGHKYPFILFFTGFSGDDFLSGKHKRIDLADKEWDWQLEGITYGADDMLYFSCEGTKEVPATFYAIKRGNIEALQKKKDKIAKKDKDEPHMSLKGHLKG